MARKEKGFSSGKGKAKKVLFIIFAFLILVGVAIVLAVTYWPAKTSDITSSLNTAVSTSLNLEGEDYLTINQFVNSHKNEMKAKSQEAGAEEKYADYYNEMRALDNILVSVSKSLKFYENTLSWSVEGKYTRRDIKKLEGNLNDASNKLQDIADYITEYKDQATNFTIVNSIWEGLRKNYQKSLMDYVEVFKQLDVIYKKGNLKGVYGNDVTVLSVFAMRNYVQLTYDNLFVQGDDLSSTNGYNISENMKKFVAIYEYSTSGEKPFENIIDYYKNDICQKNIAVVKNIESLTDNKITFAYLIQNNFDTTSLSLTTQTQKYADVAAKFLQAKNLTQTLLVPEGGE